MDGVVEGVSVEAGFFELGGNSLSAVRLAAGWTEALGRGASRSHNSRTTFWRAQLAVYTCERP